MTINEPHHMRRFTLVRAIKIKSKQCNVRIHYLKQTYSTKIWHLSQINKVYINISTKVICYTIRQLCHIISHDFSMCK